MCLATETCVFCGSRTDDGRCLKPGCGVCAACGWDLDESGACDVCSRKARLEREDADYAARSAAWAEFSSSIMQALPADLCWEFSQSNSAYARYAKRGIFMKLRISDHRQVSGGGFHEGNGARMGEADVQFVLGRDSADRSSVRAKLAAAIRENR